MWKQRLNWGYQLVKFRKRIYFRYPTSRSVSLLSARCHDLLRGYRYSCIRKQVVNYRNDDICQHMTLAYKPWNCILDLKYKKFTKKSFSSILLIFLDFTNPHLYWVNYPLQIFHRFFHGASKKEIFKKIYEIFDQFWKINHF